MAMNMLVSTNTSTTSRAGSVDGNSDHRAVHGVHYLLRSHGITSNRKADDELVKHADDSNGTDKISGTEFAEIDDGNDAVWIPPEAADNEDETKHLGAHTYDDHEEEYHDGMNWEQTGSSDSELSPAPREERQTTMLKTMDRQLKVLVSRFLASAGISLPQEDDGGETWLDIVTSLSWEAALLIKPDGKAGNEMDPGSYIKVKRVASGTRRQCEVIRGLVFKKCAAHKHMPTKCHNPRLLLLSGALGDSDVGLSSFDSVEQEKDHLEKAISQVMETCAPNVIMVEKTVSRDIQELLLNEGVTLVLDMKLHRLQRIARCSGFPIVPVTEILSHPKLKQCDYFHIEKFVDEHNHTGEGGKGPCETLMFLEGFPKPLGCTILLRGANSEELKKVKQVMLYTVFAAYHLVLEASFFQDQRVFLNDRNAPNSVGIKEETPVVSNVTRVRANGSLRIGIENYVTYNRSLQHNSDTDGCLSELTEVASIQYDSNHALSSEEMLSSVSGSLSKFIDMFRHQNIYLPVTSQDTADHQKEGRSELDQEVPSQGFHAGLTTDEPDDSGEYMDSLNDFQKQVCTKTNQQMVLAEHPTGAEHEKLERDSTVCNEDKTSHIDIADDIIDSQSILILMSSQCITKQVICEQSHLSRINYYGNFDVSLGRYLEDILQNQS